MQAVDVLWTVVNKTNAFESYFKNSVHFKEFRVEIRVFMQIRNVKVRYLGGGRERVKCPHMMLDANHIQCKRISRPNLRCICSIFENFGAL